MTRPPIVLPWNAVQQSNHRLMPIIRKTPRGMRAMLITAPEYRLAKQAAEYHIKSQWRGAKLSGPLALVARCWFPDRRKRDASNLSKLTLDAMSGICYDDDAQIEDERWIKAGIDKVSPRIEITISPIAEEAARNV